MPTLVFEEKFEGAGTWTGSAGSPTIVSSIQPPSGGKSLQCNAIGEYVYWDIPDNGYTRVVLGVWVQWDTFPAASITRAFKIDGDTTEGWCRISSSGEPNIIGDGSPSMSSTFLGSNLSTDTWYWCQIMFDKSANPWELRAKINSTVISTTGAAAASNMNTGNWLLGNTAGGEALTVYYGHAKMGSAASDDDWWDTPTDPGTSILFPHRMI